MDVSQYLEIFLDETNEHLQNLNKQILNLEQNPEDADTINEIFRAAHSLKGMAGTMGYKRMQNLTHDMENVFSEVRSGNIKVGPEMIDTLFQCLDALQEYTDNIKSSQDEGTNDNEPLIKLLIFYILHGRFRNDHLSHLLECLEHKECSCSLKDAGFLDGNIEAVDLHSRLESFAENLDL